MAIQGFNETFDANGNVISSTPVTIPERVVSDDELAQAKQTLRTMVQTFYVNDTPTGTPTNAQIRNWLLALTAGLRWLVNEMDDGV